MMITNASSLSNDSTSMIGRLWLITILAVTAITILITPDSSHADDFISPFTMTYVLSDDGSDVAETTITLEKLTNNALRYRVASEVTAPILSLIAKPVSEESDFRYKNGNITVDHYFYSRGSSNKTLTLEFTRDAGAVAYTKGDKKGTLHGLPPGTVDSSIVNLALSLAIAKSEKSVTIPVTDGKRIKHYRYDVTGREQIEIPLGRFDTIRVERSKVKKSPSKPDAWLWLSPQLSYLPVKITKVDAEGKARTLQATSYTSITSD